MNDAEVLERPVLRAAPVPSAPATTVQAEAGEAEWMRNPLGRGKSVRVLVTGKMGTKEISKLITLLEAQKAVLDDDDEEEYDL